MYDVIDINSLFLVYVNYLPWLPARPYVGAIKYNCMTTEIHLNATDQDITSLVRNYTISLTLTYPRLVIILCVF